MNHTAVLEVISGLHTGARHPVQANDVLVIGSGMDCDIILQDSGITDAHCIVYFQSGKLMIRPVKSDIEIDGKPLDKGRQSRLKAGDTVQLGESRLCFLIPARLKSRDQVTRHGRWIPLEKSLKTRLYKLLIAIPLLLVSTGIVHSSLSGTQNSVKSDAPPTQPSAEPAAKQQEKRIADNVKEVLRLSGITADSRYLGNGEVEISGHFHDPGQLKKTIGSRSMTEITGLKRILARNLAQKQNKVPLPELAIQTVVTGQDPYIVTTDGSQHYLGAELNDNFVLTRISLNEITLKNRDGEETSIQLHP
ncbi:MAG: hypothetical protein CSA52_00970 [Gammaproteobacteria bacterium]|nr:MAG: hypothetical protein CSB48_08085 [Pseudomonadota bacterium]PIE38869.1 MAG: hypothetical protein CSA52_00970 [Gammaproteobacteria bacterium]